MGIVLAVLESVSGADGQKDRGIARRPLMSLEVGVGAEGVKRGEMERETGLEPATPCLEGRYSTN